MRFLRSPRLDTSLALFIAATLVACSPGDGAKSATHTDAASIPAKTSALLPEIPLAHGGGLLTESYQSFSELVAASGDDGSLIIVGSVESSESFVDDTRTPYTISRVVASEVIAGAISEDQTISVYELGGLAYSFEKDDPSFLGSPVEIAYGSQVMHEGQRWLLFLRPYDSALLKDGYRVMGAYQGKFQIDSDDVIRFSGDQADQDSPEYDAQNEVDSLPLDEVISQIEAKLRG